MNLVMVVNNFPQVSVLVYKSVCVSSSTYKLHSGRSGTIPFDNSSTTTAEEDNFRDALFEGVS